MCSRAGFEKTSKWLKLVLRSHGPPLGSKEEAEGRRRARVE